MKKIKKEGIYLYGAGLHGAVLSDLMLRDRYNIISFIDDNLNKKYLNGIPVSIFDPNTMKDVMISFGNIDNIQHKITLHQKLKKYDIRYPNYIHPSTIISRTSKIGIGNQIFPRVVINHESKIGNFIILNTGSIIEHNCDIGDYSSISPGAVLCGNVKIGTGTFIGANATIINGITIGDNTVIGAGSTIIKDVPSNVISVGCPSKVIKGRNNRNII